MKLVVKLVSVFRVISWFPSILRFLSTQLCSMCIILYFPTFTVLIPCDLTYSDWIRDLNRMSPVALYICVNWWAFEDWRGMNRTKHACISISSFFVLGCSISTVCGPYCGCFWKYDFHFRIGSCLIGVRDCESWRFLFQVSTLELRCKSYRMSTWTFMTFNPWMLMQTEMGCHLIFWWGLRPTRWQSTWMKGIYWCRVVPTTMCVKITYKNLILQACRIFC